MLNDVRHALRLMRRSPGYAALAVVTLALGIGANTAIYSVMQAVWFDAVPFPDPGRLAIVWSAGDRMPQTQVSIPNFHDWRARTTVFEDLGAMESGGVVMVQTGEGSVPMPGLRITPGLFAILGTPPLLGRTFTEEDARAGADPVAVISHGFWVRQFGADPGVIGKSVALARGHVTVVGVMPPDFKIDRFEPALWLPLGLPPDAQRGNGDLAFVIGRLKADVALARVQAEMDAIAAALAAEHPGDNAQLPRTTVVSLRDRIIGAGVGESLFLLLGATVTVLIIACANITNLLLSRAAARTREMAVRAALGAGRARIIRLVLVESTLLAAAGCTSALLIMLWTRDALVAAMPYDLPRTAEIGINGEVVAFSAGIALAAALLTGLVPALRTQPIQLTSALLGVGSRAGGGRRIGLSRALVAAQVALAVTVVAAAWILGGTFVRLLLKDPGFDPRHVALLRVQPPQGVKAAALVDQALSVLGATPGVMVASGIDTPPFGGVSRYQVAIPGRSALPVDGTLTLDVRKVTPGYFETLRIRVIEGRTIVPADVAGAPPVVIANQAAARLLWPDETTLGQSLSVGPFKSASVVGVVADTEQSDLTGTPSPALYVAYPQFHPGSLVYAVRTAGPPGAMLPELQSRVETTGLRVVQAWTLDDAVLRSIHVPRFRALLFGLMGLLVLVLSAVGVFGVTAHGVVQRRRELGIRLALGANGRQLVTLVTSEAARPVILGLALGLLAAYNTNQLIAQYLYDTAATEPLTLAGVSAAVLGLALLAAYVPARRTLRIDPAEVLRTE